MAQNYFVGRTDELHISLDFLYRRERQERVLNVHGTGGIGKSFLLDEIGRRVRRTKIPFIRLDSRDFHHTPADLGNKIVEIFRQAINQDNDPYIDSSSCVDFINHYAQKHGLVVIAFDTYEELGDLDAWIRESLICGLCQNVRILIVGRRPLAGSWIASPAWRNIVLSVPLHPFNRNTCVDYINLFGETTDAQAETIYDFTHGHPLTLSLVMALSPAARPEFAKFHQNSETTHAFAELVANWLREVPEEIRNLIEAASVVRSFNKELLEWQLAAPLSSSSFDAVTRLSFVRLNAHRRWVIHDLLRPTLANHLQNCSPNFYCKLMERSARYYRRQLAQSAHENNPFVITDLAYILGGSTTLSNYLAKTPEEFYYAEDVHDGNVQEVAKYMELRLKDSRNFQKCFFGSYNDSQDMDEMLSMFEQKVLRFLDPFELIKFGSDTIRIVKNTSDNIMGLIINIPIHRGSIEYLKALPVTKNYFATRSEKELDEYHTPVDQPAGWFIFHAETRKDESHGAESEIVRMLYHLYTKSRMILFSTPIEANWRISAHLGYEEVKGAAHFVYGEKFPSRTFRLDLRGRKLLEYYDVLIQNAFPKSPVLSGEVFGFSKREQEVLTYITEGMSNKEIADKLFITEVAIKKHVSKMLKKARVKTRTQLVKLSIDPPI